MKKSICLAVTAMAIFVSAAACSPRNTSSKDRNNDIGNAGINQAGMPSKNEGRAAGVTYKDGVYTADGDKHDNGNENARVIIRGGKIIDVSLTATDINGNNRAGNLPGLSINNTTGVNPMDTDRGTIENRRMNDYSNMSNPNNVGNTSNNVAGSLDEARGNLINAVIQDQTYDVNPQSYDVAITSTVNNWKLAIRRALEQATK